MNKTPKTNHFIPIPMINNNKTINYEWRIVMIIGEQVVACMGIRKHEGVKCLAIYGIGEYLGEQIPTDEHPLHPKERFGQPRFAQPMVKIGDITITEWQSPFYTLHDFDNVVGKNLDKPVIQFPIIRTIIKDKK